MRRADHLHPAPFTRAVLWPKDWLPQGLGGTSLLQIAAECKARVSANPGVCFHAGTLAGKVQQCCAPGVCEGMNCIQQPFEG